MKSVQILFVLMFCLLFFIETKAQTALAGGKIPEDLLITLKTTGGSKFAYVSEITIKANGEWTQTSGGKTIITTEKLRLLIAEFEEIQFFNNFSKEVLDKEMASSPTEAQTETISIRINGQTKEISYYLGEGKQTALLRNLGERIRGAAIWNLDNDKIPQNFEVWYRVTDGDKIQRDFVIQSNGKVTESSFTAIPSPYSAGKTLPAFKKSRIAGRFSKKQLVEIIYEFEKVGFSVFKYSPLSQYSGCSNAPASADEKRTHINVQINFMAQMYASLYENCSPQPKTEAAKFEYMTGVIEKYLKNIKALK